MTSLRSTLNRRAFSDGLAPPQLSATLVLTHLFSPSFAFEAIPHELESLLMSLEFLIELNLDFVTQVRPISFGDDGDGGSELPLFVRATALSILFTVERTSTGGAFTFCVRTDGGRVLGVRTL